MLGLDGDPVPAQLSAAGVRVRAVGLAPTTAATWTPPAGSTAGATPASRKRGDLNPGRRAQPVRRAGRLLRLRDAVGGGDRRQPQLRAAGRRLGVVLGRRRRLRHHDKTTRVMRRLPDGSRMDFTATSAWWPAATTAARSRAAGQPMMLGPQRAGASLATAAPSRATTPCPRTCSATSAARCRRHAHLRDPHQRHIAGATVSMGNGAERETLLAPVAAGRVAPLQQRRPAAGRHRRAPPPARCAPAATCSAGAGTTPPGQAATASATPSMLVPTSAPRWGSSGGRPVPPLRAKGARTMRMTTKHWPPAGGVPETASPCTRPWPPTRAGRRGAGLHGRGSADTVAVAPGITDPAQRRLERDDAIPARCASPNGGGAASC